MHHDFTIARPYAKAAFALALKNDALEYWWRALEFLAEVMSDATLQNFFLNPKTKSETVLQLFRRLAANFDIKTDLRRFVWLLIIHSRLPVLPEIAHLYRQLYMDKIGGIDVTLLSADQLDNSWRERYIAALSKKFKKKVNLTWSIDTSLLGGVLIKTGDLVIDGSIAGRLEKIAQELMISG